MLQTLDAGVKQTLSVGHIGRFIFAAAAADLNSAEVDHEKHCCLPMMDRRVNLIVPIFSHRPQVLFTIRN